MVNSIPGLYSLEFQVPGESQGELSKDGWLRECGCSEDSFAVFFGGAGGRMEGSLRTGGGGTC